jgi:hypothetical protein
MTDGSRTDRRFLAALIVVPALLSASADAAELRVAQEGPVRLMPRRDWTTPIPRSQPTAPAPGQTPGAQTPGPQMPGAQGPGMQAPAEQALPDIQVKDLGSIDPEAVGILDASNGGLSASMWAGTPRATIRRLIGAIPDSIHSPVMRSLADRLLLTAAALPPPDGAAVKPADGTVLALRAGRLQKMGLVDRSKALIVASPLRASDPALIQLLVENMLLANDLGGACDETRRQGHSQTSTFWQRVTVFCQILSGDNEAAQLGASILAEAPGFDDKVFLTLVDALTQNTKVHIDSLPTPDGLHLAMLRSAKLPVPADAVDNAAPDVLRAIGVSPNTDLDLRLHAAERAALAGAIGIPRLAQIYMSIEFNEAEISTALSTAANNWTPRGRALLYRAARMQTVPTARAAVIQKAFELGQRDGQLLLLVRLYADMLKDLPVSADLAWFAGEAARGLLALGEREAARPWLTLLRERRLRDDDARNARDRLWALAILAGDDRYSVDDTAGMTAWLEALRAEEPADTKGHAYEQAGFGLVLMQAVGLSIPEPYWEKLLQPSERVPVLTPPPAFTPALENAVRAGRLGETVLLSILMVGPDGTLGADSTLLRDVIAALRSVGLESEGRALALEAALTNGL